MPLKVDNGIPIKVKLQVPDVVALPASSIGTGEALTTGVLTSEALADLAFLSAGATLLDIAPRVQLFSTWCYAACAKMILIYYEQPDVKQCQIVALVKKNNKNNGSCCPDEPDLDCILSGCEDEDFVRMYSGFNLQSSFLKRRLTMNELRAELTAKRPVEAIVKWDDFEGSHAVVITGINGDLVFVNDPLNLKKFRGWQRYDYLAAGFTDGAWNRTCTGFPNKE
jgi:hypothetical protein